jgi:hypothetical protein
MEQRKVVWILLALIVVGGAYYLYSTGQEGPGAFLPPTTEPPDETEPETEERSASLRWTMRDAIGGAALTGANEYVDTCVADGDGTFDLTVFFENTDNAASQENTDRSVPNGAAIIFHTSSDADLGTTGTDYYDNWYYIRELEDGEPVYVFSPSVVELDRVEDGKYRYKFKSGVNGEISSYVDWVEGQTNYWDIGLLTAIPRAAKDDMTFTAYYSGTALSTITDGSTWDTTTTGAADAAFTDKDEIIDLTLKADATNIAYGCPQYTLTVDGEIQTRYAFLIMATNMTAIASDALTAYDWSPVEDSTLYDEKAFYWKFESGVVPTKGTSFSESYDLPVDSNAAAASSGFYFKAWLIDMQLEENVRNGSPSTTIPTAHGFLNEFGLDAVIYARAFAASSGVGGNQVLSWVMDTSA